MNITETSYVVRLWLFLCGAARESAVGRALERAVSALIRWGGDSALCRFLWREGAAPRAWPGSFFRRLFQGILNLPVALLQWLYGAGKGVWDGSLFCRALSAVGGVPWLWLGLLMLVMLVAPHELWNNAYGLVGAVGVTGLFVLGAMFRRTARLELDQLGPYVTLYMGMICYALLTSLATRLSMRFFLFHVTAFLIALLAVSSVKKLEQLQTLCALAVGGLAIAALYGCYQGIVGVEIDYSLQDMTVNAGMPGRVYGFFDNPNNFAEMLVMLIPLDGALLLNARSWRGKFLAFAALIPCVAAIGLTYSRSGWIGLLVAVGVFLLLWNWRFLPVIAALGILAIPFLPETIWNRILTIGNLEDSSTSYRFAIYQASENLMRDYWWRGVGLGSDVMQKVFQTYPPMFDGNYPIHTHNNYLQMWGETGILGFLAYLGVLLHQLKMGTKAALKTADQRLKNLLCAAVAAFCGILVVGIAEYTWFYPRNMFVYWFLFGVIAAGVKLVRAESRGN